MGHRYFSNTREMFKTDQNHGLSHQAAERYIPMGRAADLEYRSVNYPVENIMTRGIYYSSQRHLDGGLNGLSYSNIRLEGPQFQAALSGGSLYPFPHAPVAQRHYMNPEDNIAHVNGSHCDEHGNSQFVSSLVGPVRNSRGAYKRKSPGISASCERDSINRFYCEGSSSSSAQSHVEKASLNYPGHPSSSSSWSGDFSMGVYDTRRYVRSRARVDMEIIPQRTQLQSYSSDYHGSSSHSEYYFVGMDTDLNFNTASYEQSSLALPASANRRLLYSGDHGSRHETSQHLGSRSITEINGHHEFSFRRDLNPPQYHGPHGQTTLEGDGCRFLRCLPPNRASLGHLQASAHELAHPENSLRFLSDISRYPTLSASRSWHNHQREGRPMIAAERFQYRYNAAAAHDSLGSEAPLVVDGSYGHISRDIYDLHGDMRLDVDNMSYEELLELEERIGNVNTGLSEDAISKCLMETRYNDRNREELTCAICLEEYKNGERIGTLTKCSHDYHIYCIKRWLSMKNSCPICKSSALGDDH